MMASASSMLTRNALIIFRISLMRLSMVASGADEASQEQKKNMESICFRSLDEGFLLMRGLAKGMDGRVIYAKTRFALWPGHDELA
jgi:hypothetical protein